MSATDCAALGHIFGTEWCSTDVTRLASSNLLDGGAKCAQAALQRQHLSRGRVLFAIAFATATSSFLCFRARRVADRHRRFARAAARSAKPTDRHVQPWGGFNHPSRPVFD